MTPIDFDVSWSKIKVIKEAFRVLRALAINWKGDDEGRGRAIVTMKHNGLERDLGLVSTFDYRLRPNNFLSFIISYLLFKRKDFSVADSPTFKYWASKTMICSNSFNILKYKINVLLFDIHFKIPFWWDFHYLHFVDWVCKIRLKLFFCFAQTYTNS